MQEVTLQYNQITICLKQLPYESDLNYNKKIVFCIEKLFEGFSEGKIIMLSNAYSYRLIEGSKMKFLGEVEENLL